MKLVNLLTLFIVFTNLVQLNAQDCFPTVFQGEGTFYDGVAGTSSGNCSLPVAANDNFHCALNNFDYDNSNACGACITVTGPNGSVTLQVVDRCPECASGDVDMTEEAFSQIANVIDGRVPITWQFTTCSENINNSIQVFFKEGTSQFWTAIQFRNSIHAISSMEYQLANGTWVNTSRELFNFFIEPSGIATPMNLRVTSILGEQLIFENIDFTNAIEEEINTSKQFSIPEDCNDNISIETENAEETIVVNTPVISENNEETITTEENIVIENIEETTDAFEETLAIIDNQDIEIAYYNITTSSGEFITQIRKRDSFVKLNLYNLAGQYIEVETLLLNENDISINTNRLSRGLYLINLEENNNRSSIVKKIIIK